jgi:hypothetical protein
MFPHYRYQRLRNSYASNMDINLKQGGRGAGNQVQSCRAGCKQRRGRAGAAGEPQEALSARVHTRSASLGPSGMSSL